MNDTQNTQTAVTQAADPGTPATPSPTVTHYQLLADDFMKALDSLAATLPSFVAPHVTTSKVVRGKLNVPLKFLQTSVAAVEQTESLMAVKKLDVVKGRDTLQFIDAFASVLDKVNAFAQALQFTMDSRRSVLATEALTMYVIAKGAARDPNEALGAARHLENLKRDFGKIKPKPRVVAQTPTPAPAKPAPPATPAPLPTPATPAPPATHQPALPIAA